MKRLTIRARLALVYSGLVLVAGVTLLGATYVLVDSAPPRVELAGQVGVPPGETGSGAALGPSGLSSPDTRFRINNNQPVSTDDLPAALRSSTLQTLLTRGAVALLIIAVLTGVLAWFIAGRALQPLHRITEAARRIGGAAEGGGRGLHERIGLTGPQDEVQRLADTFDGMLERLDRSFESQRRFVANASHELRTPLAINRALVEVAVTRPGVSADAVRLGESLLVVNGRHERLIDGLLTLADSENELTECREVDLAEVAEHLLDVARPQVAAAGLTLRAPDFAAAPTTGDPVLLERLVQNLVENAVRHNVPGGWITVSTGVTGRAVSVTVANSGPVVPRYEVETLFQPFRRLSGERASSTERGFGLGLSIVRAVARAHGGAVTATPHEPEQGGGLQLTVTLPLVSARRP
jgi:signal transduction histidine kinase